MSSLFEHGRETSIIGDDGTPLKLNSEEFNFDISNWDLSNVTNMEKYV